MTYVDVDSLLWRGLQHSGAGRRVRARQDWGYPVLLRGLSFGHRHLHTGHGAGDHTVPAARRIDERNPRCGVAGHRGAGRHPRRRRRVDQALFAVVMESYLHDVRFGSDDLVKPL